MKWYPEYHVIQIHFVEDGPDAYLRSIGDENLSETMVAHQFYQLLHPEVVEFIKNIVEQQNWLKTFTLRVYSNCASLIAIINDFCCPWEPIF